MHGRNFLQQAAGRKVYANGSYAPTRGQVNPKGYVRREQRRRAQGNKPASQRRSGLAKKQLLGKRPHKGFDNNMQKKLFQQILRRGGHVKLGLRDNTGAMREKLAGLKVDAPRPQKPGSNFPKFPNNDPMGPTGGIMDGVNPHDPMGRRNPSNGPTNGGVTGQPHGPVFGNNKPGGNKPGGNKPKPPAPKPPAPKPPVVNVNANGQLDLPYNPEYSSDVLGATQDLNQGLLGLQQQSQQQQTQYSQLKRDSEINYEDQKRHTLNQDSGRGMAFSSQYGNHVQENARNKMNYTNDLENANTQFNQGISTSRSGLQNNFNDYLRQLAMNYGLNLQGQAGELGFGKGAPRPQPRPKGGRKPNPPVGHANKNPGGNRKGWDSPKQRAVFRRIKELGGHVKPRDRDDMELMKRRLKKLRKAN